MIAACCIPIYLDSVRHNIWPYYAVTSAKLCHWEGGIRNVSVPSQSTTSHIKCLMPDALTYRWILVSAYNPFVNQAILAMRGVCCMFCCLLPGFATGEKGIFENIKGNLQTTKKIVVICRFLSTPFSFLSFYCACVYIFLFFLSLVGVTLLLNYCSFLSL